MPLIYNARLKPRNGILQITTRKEEKRVQCFWDPHPRKKNKLAFHPSQIIFTGIAWEKLADNINWYKNNYFSIKC